MGGDQTSSSHNRRSDLSRLDHLGLRFHQLLSCSLLLLTLGELALLIGECFELELVGGERADSSADSGVSPKHCHQDQAAEAVCAIQMSNRCLACWAPCAWTAVLMVVVDALALALEGMRTVAGNSLSGERIFLIGISYLAAGLGLAESG